MNILLLNQSWFASELREMGHTVLTCGTSPHLEHRITGPLIHIDALLRSLPPGFEPDRIAWLDNSSPVIVLGMEDCDIPILFYSVDTQHHYILHSYLAPCFDHVLVAQRDYLSHFTHSPSPTEWMPLWAPEHVAPSTEKKYGATFVGTLNPTLNPARVAFFEALQKIVPIKVLQGHYPTIFPHAEIVVNQTVKGDLNFRVFEAMMCGALLLTERTGNGLLELFQDNTHLVTYTPRDAHDAATKVSELLSNPIRMRMIAAAGRHEILTHHTMLHRAQMVEGILRNVQKQPRTPARYVGAMVNASTISALCEKSSVAVSAEAASVATNYAEIALREGVVPDHATAAQIIRTCIRHDRLNGGRRGTAIMNNYAAEFPALPLFSLLKVRALLNEGKHQEAATFAAFISPHPVTETFANAERVVSLIMK